VTLRTHEVFLASNFDEFGELRRRLRERIDDFRGVPLRAVALDDDLARPVPPGVHSLEAARRCDVMVLLVGRRYGGTPRGESASYAHLEHRAAVAAEPAPAVLPWLLRLDDDAEAALPAELAAWRRELRQLHTVGWLDGGDPELAVEEIFEAVLGTLFAALSSEERNRLKAAEAEDDLGTWGDESGEGEGPDRQEMAFLESRPGAVRDGGGDDDELAGPEDLLRHPARAAALEQRREALKAMQLGERSAAVLHFRRALEHRPLEVESSYWLAHLLSLTGRRADCQEALSLAERAVKVAGDQGRTLFAAAAHVLAARAAARLDDPDLCLDHARRGVDAAPWFAGAHLALAGAHARRGELDAAFQAAGDAFFRYPPSLRQLRRDPALQRHPRALHAFEERLGQRLREAVEAILEVEAAALEDLQGARGDEGPRVAEARADVETLRGGLDPMRLLDLVQAGRASARRGVGWLVRQAAWIRGWNVHHLGVLKAAGGESSDLVLRNREQLRGEAAARRPSFVPAATVLLPVVLTLFLLLSGWISDSRALSWFLPLVVAGFALDLAYFLHRRKSYRRRLGDLETSLETTQASADATLRQAEADYEKFRQGTGRHFQRRVLAFEEAALRWTILSPHGKLHGARPGERLRLGDEPPPGVELDHHLLPPDLRDVLALDDVALPRHRLYGVLSAAGSATLRAARWACWFEPPRGNR